MKTHELLLIFFLLFVLASAPLIGETLPLSLSDCVKYGVTGNLGFLRKQLEKEEKKLGIEAAGKIFVPEFSFDLNQAIEVGKNLSFDQTIAKKDQSGTKWGVRSFGKNPFERTSLKSRTHAFFLTRPLLKNFGRKVTGHELDFARLDYKIALEKFKSDLNSFIFSISNFYFDLGFALKNLSIQEQAYNRAKKQFDDTKHDIELGAIAEQEIYLVEENLVEFELKRENAKRDIFVIESIVISSESELHFMMPEHDLYKIQIGDQVKILFDGKEIPAKVFNIGFFPQRIGDVKDDFHLPDSWEKCFIVKAAVSENLQLGANSNVRVRFAGKTE